ncbi:conserved exported hypothetical protein [Magnetospirillum sp. SS-4]|nr:conserved exported hypothetical protein [Magnetospirillum sp. SS-4]
MDTMIIRLAVLAAALAFLPPLAAESAESTKRLGKFGEWEGFSFSEGGSRTCYVAAIAGKVQGGEKGRTNTFLIVTHRSGGKSTDEVSINGTYGFKKESSVELQIGAKKNSLFTRGDRAWANDAASDRAIVEALRKGRDAIMHATPAKGAPITATFALSGFSDALAAADKACSVKR